MTKRVLVILFLAGVTDFAAAQVNQKKSAAGSTALAPQAITAVAAQPTDDPAASMPAGWSQAAFQLTDATPVRLRLLDNLTSGTEAVGQSVHFQTIEEVRVSNVVIIPKGAPASGVIIATSRNRDQWHIAGLQIGFESVQLASGERAPLRASSESSGPATVELSGFAKEAPITRGAEIAAYLDGDFSLNASKFMRMPPAQQMASVQQPPVSQVASASPAPQKTTPPRRQPKRAAKHRSGN